jgi:hypothetical protein
MKILPRRSVLSVAVLAPGVQTVDNDLELLLAYGKQNAIPGIPIVHADVPHESLLLVWKMIGETPADVVAGQISSSFAMSEVLKLVAAVSTDTNTSERSTKAEVSNCLKSPFQGRCFA